MFSQKCPITSRKYSAWEPLRCKQEAEFNTLRLPLYSALAFCQVKNPNSSKPLITFELRNNSEHRDIPDRKNELFTEGSAESQQPMC